MLAFARSTVEKRCFRFGVSTERLLLQARRDLRTLSRRRKISRRRISPINAAPAAAAPGIRTATSTATAAAVAGVGVGPPEHLASFAESSRCLYGVGAVDTGRCTAGSAAAAAGAAGGGAWTSATAAALLSLAVAAAATGDEHGGGADAAAAEAARADAGAAVEAEGAELPVLRLSFSSLGDGAAAADGDGHGDDFFGFYGGGGGGGGGGVTECAAEDGDKRTADGGLLGNYEIGRLLGEGSFGLVYEATPVGSDRRVALKQITKLGVRREEILQEMSTLKAIHSAGGHDNIARVLDVFEDSTSYYFVLELVSGGEMFEHLTRNGPYSEATAAGFMRELGAALRFLHSHEIIHADLKPENLMLSSWDLVDSKLKVVDFGSSLRTGTDVDLSNSTLGTTWYLPPEAVWEPKPPSPPASPSPAPSPSPSGSMAPATNTSSNGGRAGCGGASSGSNGGGGGGGRGRGGRHHLLATPALDMWAVGCILYITLCGAHPFDLDSNSSEGEVVKRVKAGDIPLHELGAGISDSAKDLISRLLTRNPHDRLTAEGMMKHPWIQGRTAPERPLKGSDARLARFREVLGQKLETGVVSMLVGGAVAEGSRPDEYTFRPYSGCMEGTITNSGSRSRSRRSGGGGGGGESRPEDPSPRVGQAVDVVKSAYRAFDRRGTGRVSAKDIAGFLEEHSARVSDDERRTIDEAVSVSVAQKLNRRSAKPSSPDKDGVVVAPGAAATGDSSCVDSSGGGDGGALAAAAASTGRNATEQRAEFPAPPSSAHGDAGVKTSGEKENEARDSPASTAAALATTTTSAQTAAPPEPEPGHEAAGAAAGEEAGLDMSDFEDLLLDHLKTTDYPAGEYVFREGDAPDGGLYFIVDGRVDVLVAGWDGKGGNGTPTSPGGGGAPTSPGSAAKPHPHHAHTRVASMGPGDFFGEGGVVSSQPRGESVRAATPVKVINVSLASCHRMIDGPGKVSASLRRVALSRALFRAKNVVRAVHSVTRRRLRQGEAVFRQGEPGLSLFTVGKGHLDVVKEHAGVRRTVACLSPGSFFGEMALMTSQPRSASVVCAAEGGCVVEEISGDDFARLLMARRTGFRRDVIRMLRARQFRHGVYKLLTELGSESSFSDQELRQVFDRADTTKSGTLTLADLKAAFRRVDPLLPDSAVEEIMSMLDLEAVGSVSFEEFLKIIRWDP